MSLFGAKKQKNIGLGIDIGTVSIKAAEIQKNQAGFTLTNYAILELASRADALNNALQSSSLHPLAADLKSFLAEIKARAGFSTNHVTLSLPSFLAQTALIDIPIASKSEREIEKAAMQAASSYLPLPLTETTIRWVHIGEIANADGTKHQKILFIAIPTEQVEQYMAVAAGAGFVVDDIELENMSAARAFKSITAVPTIVIDIGGRSSTCSAVKDGILYALTQTDFSSDSATETVARALAISPLRAENLKRQSAIASTAGGHELSTIVAPIVGAILNEARRAREMYEAITGQRIGQFLLTGAGSRLVGLESYIQGQTGIPTIRSNVLGSEISYPPELHEFLPELNATLPVAIGLALNTLS
jgi:type IV pilus assembly protein PilM